MRTKPCAALYGQLANLNLRNGLNRHIRPPGPQVIFLLKISLRLADSIDIDGARDEVTEEKQHDGGTQIAGAR
jgi:hypothetical protein